MKRIAVALFTYIAVSVIVTTALRYYQYHTSPWRRVPSSAWEQLAAQKVPAFSTDIAAAWDMIETMRAGREVVALDAVQVLADLDEWLSGGTD